MISVALASSIATFCAVGTALAADTTTLKVTHVFPEGHPLWAEAGKPFTESVTAATDGKVQFEVFPSGQLGKDPLALLKSGIADIAIIATAYTPEKFPLTSVAEMPGKYDSSCEGTEKLWNVAKPGAILSKEEYAPLGLHVLFVNQPPPYKFMTGSKPIQSIDDIAGLKVRSIGFAQTAAMTSLGAIPVKIPATEMYDALWRKTADGAIYAFVGMPSFGLEDVLHHASKGITFGSAAILYVISEKAWKTLPDDTQAVLTEESAKVQQNFCRYFDTREKALQEKFVSDKGFKLTTFSPEVIAAIRKKFASIDAEWVKTMDAAGRKGSEVLEAYQQASEND